MDVYEEAPRRCGSWTCCETVSCKHLWVEILGLEVNVKTMPHFWVGATMLCSAWQSCDKSLCKRLQGQGLIWLAWDVPDHTLLVPADSCGLRNVG